MEVRAVSAKYEPGLYRVYLFSAVGGRVADLPAPSVEQAREIGQRDMPPGGSYVVLRVIANSKLERPAWEAQA